MSDPDIGVLKTKLTKLLVQSKDPYYLFLNIIDDVRSYLSEALAKELEYPVNRVIVDVGTSPAPDTKERLEHIARTLANVMQKAQRLFALETALNKYPDPKD